MNKLSCWNYLWIVREQVWYAFIQVHVLICDTLSHSFHIHIYIYLCLFMIMFIPFIDIQWHDPLHFHSFTHHDSFCVLCFVFHFMFHFVSLCHTETRPPCVVSPPPSIPPNVPEKEVSKKIGSVMPEPILSLSSFPLPWYCVAAWVLDVWWPIQTFVFCPPNVIPWFVPGITKRNGTERNGSDVLDVM